MSVICLREGKHSLPPNVRIYSLGKEHGAGRITRLVRFLRSIRLLRDEYDAVFVHMNPEYVVLGGRFWRKQHKRVSLWYAHKSVTRWLRRAVPYADEIFTSSASGFRLQSPKVHIVGQGIDTELFKPAMHVENIELRIVTMGRIAHSKNLIEMLRVLDELHARGEKFSFKIIGEADASEEAYRDSLLAEIEKRPYKEKVKLLGAMPHAALPKALGDADVFINLSTTGSMDKAVLEALASGVPAFTINEAYRELLQPFGLFLQTMEPRDIAASVESFMNRSDRAAVIATLRNKVVADHSLAQLIPKILNELK